MKIPEVQNDFPQSQVPHIWGQHTTATGAARAPGRVDEIPYDVSFRGLEAYWPFAEVGATVKDYSPNTNVGTIDGAAPNPGGIGECRLFDGTDDNISGPDDASLRPANYTVMAWVKFDVIEDLYIYEKGKNSITMSGYMFRVWSSKANILHVTGTGSTLAALSGDTTLLADTWYLLAGTFDGTNLSVYVNGVSDKTPAAGNAIYYTGAYDFVIGEAYSENYNADGSIDEVRVWSRALSAEEIKAIYRRESFAV